MRREGGDETQRGRLTDWLPPNQRRWRKAEVESDSEEVRTQLGEENGVLEMADEQVEKAGQWNWQKSSSHKDEGKGSVGNWRSLLRQEHIGSVDWKEKEARI